MLRVLLCGLLLMPGLARAQEASTLADIRQELSILFVEVQKLKRELSTTGTPDVNLSGTTALERIDAMEAELRRLTGETEELEFRVNRVVADGTNRIGDLEFRLCELEGGCDIGSLGETPTLGGGSGAAAPAHAPAPAPAQSAGPEMAVAEQADFDRAKEALDSGSFRRAADLFQTYIQTYTGGALTGEAHFLRGEALSGLGDAEGAARAYLESFSGSPDGERAPEALLNLGLKLNELGQGPDACEMLAEVTSRYPDSAASIEAQTARAGFGCT